MKSKFQTCLLLASLFGMALNTNAQKLTTIENAELIKQAKSAKTEAAENMISFLFTKAETDHKKSQKAYSKADSLYNVLVKRGDEATAKACTSARERNEKTSNLTEQLFSARDFSQASGTMKVKYKGEKSVLDKKDQPLFEFLEKTIEEAGNSKF